MAKVLMAKVFIGVSNLIFVFFFVAFLLSVLGFSTVRTTEGFFIVQESRSRPIHDSDTSSHQTSLYHDLHGNLRKITFDQTSMMRSFKESYLIVDSMFHQDTNNLTKDNPKILRLMRQLESDGGIAHN